MLSGEGKENCEKTTIGLISKKQLSTYSTLFLYISLPLFCTTTTTRWNVQKLPGYTFYGGNVVHFLVHFFHCRSFFPGWLLAFLIFSPPLQIHVVLPTKNGSLSLALALRRSFSRWASLACHLFSLFLCLSLSLYSKFVDMTINLRLILKQQNTQTIFAFRFHVYFIYFFVFFHV